MWVSGGLTPEFDALFKLSVPTELDTLVEISVSHRSVAWLPFTIRFSSVSEDSDPTSVPKSSDSQ